MICLRCDSTDFEDKEITIEEVVRNETFNVTTPGTVCTMCGWQTVRFEQLEQLRRNSADEYRRKHGLLTSSAIKAMRVALEMTQVEFAKFAGVGVASVKRWETWLIQDKSSDELLRLKFKTMLHAPVESVS